MEHFDSEKARRVWQRVQSGSAQMPQPPRQDLQSLIQRELSDGAIYQLLLRKLQGREQTAIRQIYEQKLRNIAILKGICLLSDGVLPHITAYPAEDGPATVLLRRCYGKQMQTLAEYENKTTDPQYGKIFQKLAQQELSNSCTLLEILGNHHQKTPGTTGRHNELHLGKVQDLYHGPQLSPFKSRGQDNK